jgi:hypothetical protein
MIPHCSYCTDVACGTDEDGEYTCGNVETCTVSIQPLPSVIEVSSDDEEEDEEDLS